MPKKPETPSVEEKIEIALQVLFAEISGDPEPSKTVANQYGISTRAATTIKNRALEILRLGFEDTAEASEQKVDLQTSGSRIRSLLNVTKVEEGSPASSTKPESGEKKDTDPEGPLDLDEVFAAIEDYNHSEDKQFSIYPSSAILLDISRQKKKDVDAWVKENKEKTKALIEEFNLPPRTNAGISKDIDLREELGL